MPGMFTMSPEVQAYGNQQQQPQGPEAMEQMFRQRFSDMAYQVMFSRFADIVPNVVTFKVLEQDADVGDALGVFIIVQDGSTLYIPVVLTDSQLKPMEILYSKNLGVFLPLSQAWIQEVMRLSVSEMGRGQDMPPGATTDVNIRNLVNPPTAEYGRVGYAADHEDGLRRMLTQLTKRASLGKPQFLNVLRASPKVALDGLKLAFERNPDTFAKLASCYGKTALIDAMREGYNKYASLVESAKKAYTTVLRKEGQLNILTKTASKEEIRSVFGKQAGQAFSTILQQGMAIRDSRTGLDKIAVDVEGTISLQAPGPSSGWLRIYSYDGPASNCLAIPIMEIPTKSDILHEQYEVHSPHFPKHKATKFLVVSSDMSKVWASENVVGDPLFPSKENGLLTSKAMKYLAKGDTPSVKDYGFYLNASRAGVTCTKPFVVSQITKANGVTTVVSEDCVSFIQGPQDEALRGKMVATHNDSGRTNVFLPKEANFVKITTGASDDAIWKYKDKMRQFSKSVITDPTRFRAWLKNIFKDAGAAVAGVKSAGVNEWWIDGHSTPFQMADALHKVASAYGLSVSDAAKVLDNAQKFGHANTYILNKTAMANLGKVLQKLSAEQPTSVESPNAGRPDDKVPIGEGAVNGRDANQDQQPDAPPPPSPISPTDLAIGEALQQLQQQQQLAQQQNQSQMQQLQQKMDLEAQQNQALVQVLQGIQQRSTALAEGSGGQIPMGAEQSPLVAGQAIAPTPPPQPPPPAVMEPGQLSPEKVQQQVNPSYVDQAAGMNDQGVMDAGAIAMLSSAPVFQDITSAYIPQLEKALDSIGRVLLTLWIKERETKASVGDESFMQLQERLRNLFKNMGELVLQLNRYGASQDTTGEQKPQQQPQHMQGA